MDPTCNGDALDRMKRLTHSQLDELCYRLEIDRAHLPSPLASRTQRAIAVIDLMANEGASGQARLLGEIARFLSPPPSPTDRQLSAVPVAPWPSTQTGNPPRQVVISAGL